MCAGAPEPAGPDNGHLGGVRHGGAQHSTRHHQRASGGYRVLVPVLRIRCLFDPWIRDPGWVESQHPGSGMNNPEHIF
jgi:hypothetical protein